MAFILSVLSAVRNSLLGARKLKELIIREVVISIYCYKNTNLFINLSFNSYWNQNLHKFKHGELLQSKKRNCFLSLLVHVPTTLLFS